MPAWRSADECDAEKAKALMRLFRVELTGYVAGPPFIVFRMPKRVDGKLPLAEAVKGIRMAAE